MFSRSRTLLRVRGIPVRVDLTWLVILLLVGWSLWARLATQSARGHPLAAATEAAAATILFFGSLLAHELAHALMARRRGLAVRSITLYLFGGATDIGGDLGRAGDEFAVTAVGPGTSLGLGAGLLLAGWGADAAGWVGVADVARLVGELNLLLGGFNLLPGVPLDGGRLLDSALWRLTGDRVRAARLSSRVGQALGGLLVVVGVAEALTLVGGFVGGLWLVLIGWFLLQAARAEGAAAELRADLAGRSAGSVALPLPWVPTDAGLRDVVRDVLVARGADVVLVAVGARPVGVLLADDIRRLPGEQLWTLTAGAVMRPLDRFPRLAASAPAAGALGEVAAGPVLVVDDDRIVGVLTWRHLVATAERAHLMSHRS